MLFWGRLERRWEDRGCKGLLLEDLLLAKGSGHLHLKDEEYRDVLEGYHIVDLASIEELRQVHVHLLEYLVGAVCVLGY